MESVQQVEEEEYEERVKKPVAKVRISVLQMTCMLLFMTPQVLTAICSCMSNIVLPSSNAVLPADLLLQGHHCVFIEVWFLQDTKMADAPAAAPAKPDEQPATDGEVRSNGPSEVCSKAILPQGCFVNAFCHTDKLNWHAEGKYTMNV